MSFFAVATARLCGFESDTNNQQLFPLRNEGSLPGVKDEEAECAVKQRRSIWKHFMASPLRRLHKEVFQPSPKASVPVKGNHTIFKELLPAPEPDHFHPPGCKAQITVLPTM